MKILQMRLMPWLMALVLCATGMQYAQAETPSCKDVQIIHAFPPGTVGDTALRIFGEQMSKQTGQSIVIVPKPGGNGVAAALAALEAPPDGCTLVMLTSANAIAVADAHVQSQKLPYSLEKFTALSKFFDFSNVVATSADSPFKEVGDVINYAKKNPGRLAVGVSTKNSANDLAAELFERMTGVKLVIVRHSGASAMGAMMAEVTRGDTGIIIQSYGALRGQFKAGALRPLAVTVAHRQKYLPGVPTVAESVPGYEVLSWTALYVPKGTPAERTGYLADNIRHVLENSALREKFLQLGIRSTPSTAAELDAQMQTEVRKWTPVLGEIAEAGKKSN